MTTTERSRETAVPAIGGLRGFAPWPRIWREVGVAAIVGVIAVALGAIALNITLADLGQRWQTGGADQVLHYTIFSSGADVFPYFPNDRLGFPAAQNLFFAPLFDFWSAIYVRIAGLLGANGIVALNLYNVLSFFWVGFAAYVFFRALRVRRVLAAVFAVAFSIAPFHFYQIGIGHPFIANYWAVPVIGVLALMIAGERTDPFHGWIAAAATKRMAIARRITPIVVLTAAVAWTQSYYYVFGAILLGGVWLFSGLRTVITTRRMRVLLWPTITTFALVALIGLQLAVLSLNLGDRYARYFGTRTPGESEYYGGKIANLLLPAPGSGIGLFARVARDYAAQSGVVRTAENPWTAAIASIAMGLLMLALLVRLFLRRGEIPGTALSRFIADDRVGVLSATFLWGLLFYVTGGLGVVFAYLASPEVRAWSRMSIVLSMLALGFLAILIQTVITRRAVLIAVVVLIAAFVLVDQLGGIAKAIPLQATDDAAIRTYTADAEKALKPDCGVVELPLKGFPETGTIGAMGDYDQALPYINATTNGLRWSYGAVRGTTSADFWTNATTPASFAKAVHDSGACAVQVDTTAYGSNAAWHAFVATVADPDNPLVTSPDTPSRYELFRVTR